MTNARDAHLALRRSQEQVALIRQQSDHEDAELLPLADLPGHRLHRPDDWGD